MNWPIKPKLMKYWRSALIECDSGVALIEFSLTLPLLLLLFFGMIEATNFVIYNQKVDKIANSMADFVTQGTTVGRTQLNNFAVIASTDIMQPYNFSGTIIFSSVASYTNLTAPCTVKINCMNWQHTAPGGLGDISNIGVAVNGAAILPNGYSVAAGQNVIVAEVFDHYQPLLSVSGNFLSAFNAQTIYKIAVFKPRLGTLTTLGP